MTTYDRLTTNRRGISSHEHAKIQTARELAAALAPWRPWCAYIRATRTFAAELAAARAAWAAEDAAARGD